ncbi:antibiotic biosynthesis monooxygenase family protein [Actinosynnema sp. CS-041913]|uniref:antibiotic biosynthesis monooxygenase family protein n=1 Tax=Actinosynnema sp. CS-041913 TaxID=3239917 RepID=UPI003D94590D
MTGVGGGVFRVMLRMEIKPGLEDEFVRVWRSIGDAITSHPASLGQWLSRSAEEPGVFYVVSDWVDEERFREFETSGRHVDHRTKLHPFRVAASMVTMRVVAHMANTGGARSHREWEAVR